MKLAARLEHLLGCVSILTCGIFFWLGVVENDIVAMGISAVAGMLFCFLQHRRNRACERRIKNLKEKHVSDLDELRQEMYRLRREITR